VSTIEAASRAPDGEDDSGGPSVPLAIGAAAVIATAAVAVPVAIRRRRTDIDAR
jgi:hypothetical protein